MRTFFVILGLLLVVATLGLVKFSQISTLIDHGQAMEEAGPPPEAVGSAVAKAQSWEPVLSAVGTVATVQGVALGNESPGVVTRIAFESGSEVEQGQVLVELDTSVERAELASAKSRLDLAQAEVERARALVASGVGTQQQLDAAEAQLKTSKAEVASLRAQIERKVVRAPFSGRLGIRQVNLGQYLGPGTPITVLEAAAAVYVDFSLPQQRAPLIRVGMPVRATLEGPVELTATGAIAAIEPTVDETTRTLGIRATVGNERGHLRPGMFVDVAVVLPDERKVVIVPAMAVVHAPYGDSVFVIEDKKPAAPGRTEGPGGKPVRIARQQFVRLGEQRGDFVVIESGLGPGQEVVSAGAFKLRNGAPIVVDNTVQPEPELEPRPENR